MSVPVVVLLEPVHIDHEEREQMLRAQRPVRLRLESAIEVAAVEGPRERVGLREALQGLAVLLLHEDRADVRCEQLERREVLHLEGLPVLAVGDAQDAAGLVVDDDGHADERLGAVAAVPRRPHRGIGGGAHEQGPARRNDVSDDALAGADPYLAHDLVRETQRARDHELARAALAQDQRGPLSTNELRGDPKNGVEQILSSTLRRALHVSPLLRPTRPAEQAGYFGPTLLRDPVAGSVGRSYRRNKRALVSDPGQSRIR